MLVTVVAVLCQLQVAHPTLAADRDCTSEEVRVEEIVTDTDMDENVTMWSCQAGGQAPLAKWKSEHPVYHSDRWRIARVMCVPGHYELRGRA